MRLRSTRAGTTAHQRRVSPWAIYNDLTGGVLDSRISFSRAGLAMVWDAAGNLVYAPHNLALWSEDISNAAWTKTGVVAAVATANAGLAPDGSNTASLIDLTPAADARIAQTYSNPVPSGFAITMSVWLRAESGQSGLMGMQVRRADASTPNTLLAVTDQWQRFTWTVGATAGTTPALWWIAHRGLVGHTLNRVLVWGAQIEYATAAGEYRKTTALAYHGPRFARDPVTLQPLGLQIEAEARTNLLTNSVGVGGTASAAPTGWSFSSSLPGSTASYAYGTEDGMPYVDVTLTATNNTGAVAYPSFIFGGGAGGNSTAYATSIFCRKLAGATAVSIAALRIVARDAGTVAIGQAVTPIVDGASLRVSRAVVLYTTPATATATVNHSVVFTLPAGGVLDITLRCAYPQIEAGTSASSPMPTTTGIFTRAADVANITAANFPPALLTAAEFTLFAHSLLSRAPGTLTYPSPVRLLSADVLSRVSTFFNGTTVSAIGEVVTANVNQGTSAVPCPIGVFHKTAVQVAANNLRLVANGALGALDTSVALPQVTRAEIGAAGFMGFIKALGIAPAALPDAELLALTAA